MNLGPGQYFIYAWRYEGDTACKLGVSTLQSFYARIKAARTVTYQDIELLGIEVFGTEAEARTAYQQRLKTFARVADRRAWVDLMLLSGSGPKPSVCPILPPSMLSKMPFRMIQRAVKRSASINNAGLRKNGRRETAVRRNPVRNARRRIALMNGNILESGGKMTLHIRRSRCSVRRRGERRTPVMIKIGMRLTRNTQKIGRRRVGNGMRMTLSIGHSRNNGVGNLHRIIRTIRKSGGCICKSIVGGRRRIAISRQPSAIRKNSSQQSAVSGQQSAIRRSRESEFPPTEDREWNSLLQKRRSRAQLAPTEECVFIIFRYFVNITGIYKVIEGFTVLDGFMSFCRARRLGCRWFW